MASRVPVAKENSHGGDKRTRTQHGHVGSGGLWSNQDEMKRYVSKLKSEIDEQKSRVKRVHRDKAEEIKRLQENLDSEKQKAIENVSKKLESDKAYELKKLKESVVKQKEFELRQVLRVKDEEMRALKQELQESKNTTRSLELENKRIMNEQSRSEPSEQDRRWKGEVSSLRNDKRRLEKNLRIKSEADFEKAELIRKMKLEHDTEIRRLTRESKRESLKEFRQLKAVSKEVELKNHQLAAKEAEMRRLERERNESNSQRRGSLNKTNSFNSQKVKAATQNSESDFDNAAEERIKKLKMRNSELVAIARKLEEKAKQLQEERDLLEKSNEASSNPGVGNLKKAFARQRARDLAERANLLMNKDNEINNLKKEVEETRHNGYTENGGSEELEKIVHQTSKERLLLEKEVSSKVESLLEEIKDITAENTRLTSDNDVLRKQVSKLEDFESKHRKTLLEINEIQERNAKLENACSEKDKKLYKLDLEKQTYTAKNNELQTKNNDLLVKVDQLNKIKQECSDLKESVQTLTNENRLMKEENAKLRTEIAQLFGVKKDVERLQQENVNLERENGDVMVALKERENEISSLHEAQEFAQRKYSEDVSGLEDMVRRLNEQQAQSMENRTTGTQDSTSTSSVLTSTPKDSKCTQTSRPSSPVMSPIIHNGMQSLQQNNHQDEEDKSVDGEDLARDLLTVPYNGTSSSTSFDLEKAGTRIQQLAASDSDEVDCNGLESQKQEFSVSSEISGYSEDEAGEGASEEDSSYSADVSRTSDVEEQFDRTLQDDEEESDNEDPRNDIYIGSPLQDIPDLEEKLSIFIAKFNYDPMLYSPNENPETELAFQAGDYLYVYGDLDEDGFYVGELMNGERGLVPSNFVERIAEEEAILKESDEIEDDDYSEEDSSDEEIILKDEDGKKKVIRPKAFSERRHEMFRSSLDHVLTEQLDDIRESEEDDLGTSSLSEDELGNRKNRSSKPEADQVSSEGLDSMDSDVPAPRVPSPTKLSLERQFTNSALVSWQGSTLPSEEIQGYNIYLDGKLKTQVKGSKKTNVVVEDIRPTETYRLSVRTKSVNGVESPDIEATMVFGPDAKLSPGDLRVVKISATSGEVQWLPAHSGCEHEVFLNESLLERVRPGCFSYTINDLSPATLYQVKVRTQIPDNLKMAAGLNTLDSAEVEFTTADGGLPEPPVDLRLAQRTSENILLAWLPVTLSVDGYSNGYKVSSYKVYVNGIYCTETVSACMDSVNITMEKLRNLGRRHDFSRMRFVVRTLSVLGESVDSNVVDIASDDARRSSDVNVINGVGFAHEKGRISPKTVDAAMKDNIEGVSRESGRNTNSDLLDKDGNSVDSHSERNTKSDLLEGGTEVNRSENETIGSEYIFVSNAGDENEPSNIVKQVTLDRGSSSENRVDDSRESERKSKSDLLKEDARVNLSGDKAVGSKRSFSSNVSDKGEDSNIVEEVTLDKNPSLENSVGDDRQSERSTKSDFLKDDARGSLSGDKAVGSEYSFSSNVSDKDEGSSIGEQVTLDKDSSLENSLGDCTQSERNTNSAFLESDAGVCLSVNKTVGSEHFAIDVTDEDEGSNVVEQVTSDGDSSLKNNVDDSRELERNTNSNVLEDDAVGSPSGNKAVGSEHSFSTKGLVQQDSISKNTKQQSEPDRKPTVTKASEMDNVVKGASGYVAELEGVSSKADVPTTIVRRQPIVTRYDDGETESESYSTESKTDETEEELIEIFTHLEISENKDIKKSNVCEDKKEMPEGGTAFACERRSESAGTKNDSDENIASEQNITSEQLCSEHRNSEEHDSEESRSKQPDEFDHSISEHLKEAKVAIAGAPNLESKGETKTGNDEEHKTDSASETGISRTSDSLATEQHSESETESEIQDEVSHAKHLQKVLKTAVSKDAENGTEARVLSNVGSLQSESETETDYGPPLSVIDEVDEDNLTDTNNPTTQGTTRDTTSDGEATLSNNQLNSLPVDSSKSSDLSGSKTQTLTSDDEGFRTEDDVLDLLHDDEGLGESRGEGGLARTNEDKGIDDRTNGDEVVVRNRVNGVNNGGIGSHVDNGGVLGDKTDSVTEDNKTDRDYENHEETLSCNIPESVEANVNGCSTEDESTDDFSDSTCPTRTSLKSDSSLSISEAPPPADHAMETLLSTLSLPSNREKAPDESDHNGNVLGGSETTAEVMSEGERSGSEMGENVSEQVRYFIALYSYDPSQMSPNEDGADEELPFSEGDIVKVFGDKDDDGFFWGECKNKQGFVPSNMISEMNINEAEDLFNEANNDVRLHNELNEHSRGQVNGELDVDVISENLSPGSEETGASDRLSFWENLENDDLGPRKMKALYDYDPVRDSPNVDSEVELKFKAGEIIYVLGGMDDDGFFKGELNGVRGLVPSNFLRAIEDFSPLHDHVNSDSKQPLDSNTDLALSTQERQSSVGSSNNVHRQGTTEDSEVQQKKKKNIFSKGRKIFKKAFK